MVTSMAVAGDKVVELVDWLRKGGIEREVPLLEALAQAPLPRKAGAPSHNQNIAAPAGALLSSPACACKPVSHLQFSAHVHHAGHEQHGTWSAFLCAAQHADSLLVWQLIAHAD